MVLQSLVSWVQNSQLVNIHSMSPPKTEQTVPLKSGSGDPKVQSPLRPATVLLGVLCCASLLVLLVLAILYGKAVRCSPNPEAANAISQCRNLTAQLHSITESHAHLQTSVTNLTAVNLQVEQRREELSTNNSLLMGINHILSVEAAWHQDIISNLTESNRQLNEENGRLTVLGEALAEERDNMSASIVVLQRRYDNLTELYKQEHGRAQMFLSSNTNLTLELRESAENNTLLWAQSQQVLNQNVLLQTEKLKLNETVIQTLGQLKKCQRHVRNLMETHENQVKFQNENSSKEIGLLRKGVQDLQEDFVSLDQYCPVVNQTTQERRCRQCQDGWRLFRSRCYFLSSDVGSWGYARKQCQSQGAELLMIDSREEQSFVFAMMSMKSSPKRRAWLGMTDAETEGVWRWLDGSLVRDSAQYWLQRADGSSEPDNWKVSEEDEGGEDCGHLDTAETEFSCWMDAPCSATYRWICEKQL